MAALGNRRLCLKQIKVKSEGSTSARAVWKPGVLGMRCQVSCLLPLSDTLFLSSSSPTFRHSSACQLIFSVCTWQVQSCLEAEVHTDASSVGIRFDAYRWHLVVVFIFLFPQRCRLWKRGQVSVYADSWTVFGKHFLKACEISHMFFISLQICRAGIRNTTQTSPELGSKCIAISFTIFV